MRVSILFPAAVLLPQVFGQLNTLAKAKGFTYFGSATDNGELTDSAYTAILSDNTEFGQITPGNSQKWDTTEPTQGTFSFTKGDVITALAAKNSQLLRCHTLVWYSQLPSWVSGGTWTNATLTAVMENHITKVMEHYKGQCTHWDVVNEAFNEDGTYRTSIFYTTIGEAYIPLAFKAAATADPTAKLYYNDYNIESSGAKSTAAQALVKSLKSQGVQIDGVGMQAHFIVGSTPSLAAQTANLEAFTALGVEVAYTELDIRHPSVPASATQLATQATDYVNTINACLAVNSCVGITIWDFSDKYSWIPSVFSGAGEACLYNEDLTKKPAYDAVVSVLGGSASATKDSGSSSIVASTSAAVLDAVASSAAATTLATSVKPVISAVASSSAPSSVVEVSGEVPIVSSVPTTSAKSPASPSTNAADSPVASSSTKDSCKSKSKAASTSVISSPTQVQNSTTPATTGTSGVMAKKYYQCGGIGWTGATACVEGSTCTVMNDWYSQCL